MSGVLLAAASVMVVLIAVGLSVVWRGPTVFDRVLALAHATAVVLILLVLLGFIAERPVLFLDIALTYALLTLVLPVAMSTYVALRHDEDARSDDTGGAP